MNSITSRCRRREQAGLPLVLDRAPCGFPSPAQDYIEQSIDLNDYCVRHPAATYLVQASGDSMRGAGIIEGDVLVVDRSLTAQHRDIVIAAVNGEMVCKRLELTPRVRLVSENPAYAPLVPAEGETLDIFGVVVSMVRRIRS
jgi:DNA polymerase V